jgi:hypothetical protein
VDKRSASTFSLVDAAQAPYPPYVRSRPVRIYAVIHEWESLSLNDMDGEERNEAHSSAA